MLEKVTVIINTVNEDYNYLKLAIESYLKQQGIELELILSTVTEDKSILYVKEHYPTIKVVTIDREFHPIGKGAKSPRGSFMQLNNGIAHMTGDWYTWGSSNDIAHPFKCAMEVRACKDNNKEVCYSAYTMMNKDGEPTKTHLFHDYDYDKHLLGNFVADCSIISKRLIDKYMPFRIELNNYAYWDLWLRIYKEEGNVFVYNSTPTWLYRQDPDSMHIKRSKDPVLLELEHRDREIMLNLHK